MAFLVVPVAGGAIGGLAGVSLAWSYTKAANTTAEQLYGAVSPDAISLNLKRLIHTGTCRFTRSLPLASLQALVRPSSKKQCYWDWDSGSSFTGHRSIWVVITNCDCTDIVGMRCG